MRVTPGMTASRYKTNLANATAQRDYYFNRSVTLREFSTPSEDPTKAARAYRLRTSSMRNNDYTESAKDMKDRMNTADSAVYAVVNMLHNVHDQVEAGMNGTNEKFDRKTYAQSLRKEALPSIVSSMNASDGDQYLFGGLQYRDPPFTVENGELYYRNINVNTGKTNAYAQVNNTMLDFGKANTTTMAGNYKVQIEQGAANSITVGDDDIVHIAMKEGSTIEDLRALFKATGTNADVVDATGAPTGVKSSIDFSQATATGSAGDIVTFSKKQAGVIQPTDVLDVFDLGTLQIEPYYVDIGMGLEFDDFGNINPQSAFDASLPGISVIGYGKTEGMPNNAYTLISEIADILEDESLSQEQMAEKLAPYLDQVNTVQESTLKKETDIGSKVTFLENTIDRLDETQNIIDTQQTNLEYADPGEAATDWMMAQFLFNSVLRLGTEILQTSLLDFMK